MNPIPVIGMVAGLLASRTAQTAILRITGSSALHVLGALGIGIAIGNVVEREVKDTATQISDQIKVRQTSK